MFSLQFLENLGVVSLQIKVESSDELYIQAMLVDCQGRRVEWINRNNVIASTHGKLP